MTSAHVQLSWCTLTMTFRPREVIWSTTSSTRWSHLASTSHVGDADVKWYAHVMGSRIDLKPADLIESKVEGTTGALFQSPSFWTASSVLPRFQPGFKEAMYAEALTGVNVPVHLTLPLVVGVEVGVVEVDGGVEVVIVDKVELDVVIEAEVDEVAVPGTHWEYPVRN